MTHRIPLPLTAALLCSGCSFQPMELECVSATASYILERPNGTTRTADLGCRAGIQAAAPTKGQRRVLLRLDTGGVVATSVNLDTGAGGTTGGADTGAAPASEDWTGTEGVIIGLAWSGWNKRLNDNLEIEPWIWPVPDDAAALGGVTEAFATSPELPETAVLAAFFTPDASDTQREIRSGYQGGWVRASRYEYQKEAGGTVNLQLLIDQLELEDGSVLTLEADVQMNTKAVTDAGG